MAETNSTTQQTNQTSPSRETRVPDQGAVKKCGPKTIPLYDCGGLAYVYCLKSAGHDGQHAP